MHVQNVIRTSALPQSVVAASTTLGNCTHEATNILCWRYKHRVCTVSCHALVHSWWCNGIQQWWKLCLMSKASFVSPTSFTVPLWEPFQCFPVQAILLSKREWACYQEITVVPMEYGQGPCIQTWTHLNTFGKPQAVLIGLNWQTLPSVPRV